MDASVLDLGQFQWMFIRANAADSHSLVMVAAKYFLSLRNVLCHRARSAHVICNIFEIHNNLHKFGRNSWLSPPQLKRSFSALSHLHRQKNKIKIRGDGGLIDIHVSPSEPDTE